MLSTLRMANISSTDAEQFSCCQVELCEALLDMSSERVDEAVTTEPVELEQVSLIKYEQKFIWILIMQLAIRLILWMRLLYQSKSMVRIINWLEITDGFRSRKKYNDIQYRLLGISL